MVVPVVRVVPVLMPWVPQLVWLALLAEPAAMVVTAVTTAAQDQLVPALAAKVVLVDRVVMAWMAPLPTQQPTVMVPQAVLAVTAVTVQPVALRVTPTLSAVTAAMVVRVVRLCFNLPVVQAATAATVN